MGRLPLRERLRVQLHALARVRVADPAAFQSPVLFVRRVLVGEAVQHRSRRVERVAGVFHGEALAEREVERLARVEQVVDALADGDVVRDGRVLQGRRKLFYLRVEGLPDRVELQEVLAAGEPLARGEQVLLELFVEAQVTVIDGAVPRFTYEVLGRFPRPRTHRCGRGCTLDDAFGT